MFFLILLIVFIVIMAIQVNEGWVKTKEVIHRGEEPSLFLVLYTSFACLWLMGFLIVFYFKMIYTEKEKYKNPVAYQANINQNQPPSKSGGVPTNA